MLAVAGLKLSTVYKVQDYSDGSNSVQEGLPKRQEALYEYSQYILLLDYPKLKVIVGLPRPSFPSFMVQFSYRSAHLSMFNNRSTSRKSPLQQVTQVTATDPYFYLETHQRNATKVTAYI